jgi:hypothetical protein
MPDSQPVASDPTRAVVFVPARLILGKGAT